MNSIIELDFYKKIKFSIFLGFLSLFLFFIFFISWISFFPLSNVLVFQGNLNFDFNKKKVFYYDQGIVEKIFIKNGDWVYSKQPLILFTSIKYKSELRKILWQLQYCLLIEYRISKTLKFISKYQAFGYNSIFNLNYFLYKTSIVIFIQNFIFNCYFMFFNNSIKIFIIYIKHYISEIILIKTKILFIKQNINFIKKEFIKYFYLYSQNLESFDKLFTLHNDLHKLINQVLDEQFKIIFLHYNILENYFKILLFYNNQQLKNIDEYKKNHIDLIILESLYNQYIYLYDQTVIIASADGIIDNLIFNLSGNIYKLSSIPILEIIFQYYPFVIESFIHSKYINFITVGSKVKFFFTGYKKSKFSKLNGTILYIYNIKYNDFYKLIISINSSLIDFNIIPNMPVIVFFNTII